MEVDFCVCALRFPTLAHTQNGPYRRVESCVRPLKFLQKKFQFQLFCMLGQKPRPKVKTEQ